MWALQSKVKDALRSGTSKDVLVIADRRAKVDHLIEVVDLCKMSGAKAVTVATEQEGS
jgi:biopolymer transport protein ExbD